MYITYTVGEFLWMQGQLMLHPRQYDMCVWVEEEEGGGGGGGGSL